MTTRRDLTEDGELLSETSVKRAFLLQNPEPNRTEDFEVKLPQKIPC